MPVYTYKGYDSAGRAVSGSAEAATAEEIERRMMTQSVTLVSLKSGSKAKAGTSSASGPSRPSAGGGKVNDGDRAQILRSLATMIETGVPLLEAIQAVEETCTKKAAADALSRVRADLLGGASLSQAVAAAPAVFPASVAEMCKVAENGGRLDLALDSAAMSAERSAEFRKRVVSSLVYPCAILGVSVIAVLVIILFVMPQFKDVFRRVEADLPITTKALMTMSSMLRDQPILSIGGLIAVGVGTWFVFRIPALREKLAGIGSRLPLIGDILARLGTARAMRTMATLSSVNVPLTVSLEHAAKTAGYERISRALHEVSIEIQQGRELSDALRRTKAFPPTVIQMIVVGERSGRLDKVLSKCADKMESDTDNKLKQVVSVFEPTLILLTGVVVGAITVSILLPIYTVMQNGQ